MIYPAFYRVSLLLSLLDSDSGAMALPVNRLELPPLFHHRQILDPVLARFSGLAVLSQQLHLKFYFFFTFVKIFYKILFFKYFTSKISRENLNYYFFSTNNLSEFFFILKMCVAVKKIFFIFF